DLNITTILAMTLQGITSTFYKIPVTAELSEAVARGRYTLHCSSSKLSVHPRSMILACLEA
ncbi:hypothetical protein P692DRAFT_20726586, partial [Suillus brevipes Sb2]